MIGKTVFIQHSSIHKIDEIIGSSLTRYPEADRRCRLAHSLLRVLSSLNLLRPLQSVSYGKHLVQPAVDAVPKGICGFEGRKQPAALHGQRTCPAVQVPKPRQPGNGPAGSPRVRHPSSCLSYPSLKAAAKEEETQGLRGCERSGPHRPTANPTAEAAGATAEQRGCASASASGGVSETLQEREACRDCIQGFVHFSWRHVVLPSERHSRYARDHGKLFASLCELSLRYFPSQQSQPTSITSQHKTIALAPKPPLPPDFDNNPPPPPKKKKKPMPQPQKINMISQDEPDPSLNEPTRVAPRPVKGRSRNRDREAGGEDAADQGESRGSGEGKKGRRSRSSGRARHSGITEEVF